MQIEHYRKDIGALDQEMIDFFYKRTDEHINRVKKYIDFIYSSDPSRYFLLINRKKTHDQSKYLNPEIIPYIYLTWKYHCKQTGKKFETTKELEKEIQKATYHHVKSNAHHPEFHDSSTTLDSINPKDRDKPPERIVDGTKMSEIDIAEMVADWLSMSEELGTDTRKWAESNINVRWKFTDAQVKHI
jgi:hypothetical protein